MVVDASAIIAFAFGESTASEVERRLAQADTLSISAASVLECEFVLGRRFGPAGAEKLDELLREAGIAVVAFDGEQLAVARAAHRRFGKGHHPAQLNYGDCFAYALAKTLDEPLLFVGADFSQTDVVAALA